MKKVWRRIKEVFGLLLILAVIAWGAVIFWKDGILNILYEEMQQYAYLDKYILQDEEVSLQDLIEFSNGGEGKKRDFVGKRIHFAAYSLGELWGNVYVYKGHKEDVITADWQSYVDDLNGFVMLKWGKAEDFPKGYTEIDGVITDIEISSEITPEIYVKKIEKKDFEDIEWEDWQVMTKKKFEVKKKIKPDIEIMKGGIKRYFKSIEFSDMGAKLTFVPEKLRESSFDDVKQENGTIGNVEIDYNGKKYRRIPTRTIDSGSDYIREETIFIKEIKAQGMLKMQLSIVGSEKSEIIEISLDDDK